MDKPDYEFTVKIPVRFQLGCTIEEEAEVKQLLQDGIVTVLNSIKRQENIKTHNGVWIPELSFGKVSIDMKSND